MELVKKKADVVSKFEISPPDIKKMVAQYLTIMVPPDDAKAYKYARAALTTCVKTRTGIDTRRLDLGKEARAFIKDVNGTAKDLVDLLSPAENHLREQLEAEDNRKKAIQDEIDRIERERVEKIQVAITAIRALANTIRLRLSTVDQLKAKLAILPDAPDEEFYQEFYQDAVTVLVEVRQTITEAMDVRQRLDKEDAERKAEAERLEKLRMESEANQKRLEDEKAAFEAEKKAAEEADEKRKADEAADALRKKAELEAEAKKRQEEFDAQVAAAKKEADDRQKELDEQARKIATEKARIAFEQESKRLEAEAKERADKDAKEAVARLKAEEEAKAKADKEAMELAEKLRPDREKAMGYLESIMAVRVPEVEDVNVQNELANVARLIRELATEYKGRFNPKVGGQGGNDHDS